MHYHKKNIYLATCGFPWGKGEKTFILPELSLLSERYQVTILACASDKIVAQKQWETKVEDNISVLRFPDNPLSLKEKILESFCAILSGVMWKEIVEILRKHEKVMARIKDSFNFFVVANRYKRWLEKEKILCDEKAVFYSFWSTTFHLAAVMEKKKYQNLKIVSRLHGFDLYDERCSGMRQPFKKYLDQNSDKLLFASDYGLEYYVNRFSCEEKKCKICHIGIRGVCHNGRHCENNTFYLVSCSNVINLKRVDLIIKALARIKDIPIHWTHFGDGEELLKIKKVLETEGIKQLTFIGKVSKSLVVRRPKFDSLAIEFLKQATRLNDDAIMLFLVDELRKLGITVLDQTIFIKNLMVPRGVLGKIQPTEAQLSDVEYGYKIAKEMGELDIGQSVVIKDRMIMAIEAIEGTDKCIKRGCKLGKKDSVIVKVSKPKQDKRFDIPAFGLKTLKTMKRYKAKLIAVEANETILVDYEKTIEFADKNNIVVMAV